MKQNQIYTMSKIFKFTTLNCYQGITAFKKIKYKCKICHRVSTKISFEDFQTFKR